MNREYPPELAFDRHQFEELGLARWKNDRKPLRKTYSNEDADRMQTRGTKPRDHSLPWWWGQRALFERVFRQRAKLSANPGDVFLRWLWITFFYWNCEYDAAAIPDELYYFTGDEMTVGAVRQTIKRLQAVTAAEMFGGVQRASEENSIAEHSEKVGVHQKD